MSNKKTVNQILATYDRQIRKDMGFWIKYRPSRWGDLLPEKPLGPLIKFIKTKGGKKFVLVSALILSTLLVGIIPTLNFIWSNIFRLGLFLLVSPIIYWAFAIISIYARVMIQVFCKLIRFLFYKLIE
tara:strand:+ start:117 stop:500 length:384 start_codon:yes stop_codon:yes gene_type:complete